MFYVGFPILIKKGLNLVTFCTLRKGELHFIRPLIQRISLSSAIMLPKRLL